MQLFSRMVAAIAILVTAGCAADQAHQLPTGQKLYVSQAGLDYYKEYLETLGNNRGAFAISTDGDSAAYSLCPATRCVHGPTATEKALQLCESKGATCVIFATNRDIKVDYELVK